MSVKPRWTVEVPEWESPSSTKRKKQRDPAMGTLPKKRRKKHKETPKGPPLGVAEGATASVQNKPKRKDSTKKNNRKQKKIMHKKKKKKNNKKKHTKAKKQLGKANRWEKTESPKTTNSTATNDAPSSSFSSKPLSKLQEKLAKQLQGARFRWINEQLYSIEGKEAEKLFKEQPILFQEYHEGFRKQVKQWPENPLDHFIREVRAMPKHWKIADMGCGEARLAQSVPHTVFSFDLYAANKYITPCDIANVPLEKKTIDAVVFCLALMGTNFMDYIVEAHRILKLGGLLHIAEVKSRFHGDTDGFVKAIESASFKLQQMDDSNRMFAMFRFVKSSAAIGERANYSLKACKYKKR